MKRRGFLKWLGLGAGAAVASQLPSDRVSRLADAGAGVGEIAWKDRTPPRQSPPKMKRGSIGVDSELTRSFSVTTSGMNW